MKKLWENYEKMLVKVIKNGFICTSPGFPRVVYVSLRDARKNLCVITLFQYGRAHF
jgi:hypothetical protein